MVLCVCTRCAYTHLSSDAPVLSPCRGIRDVSHLPLPRDHLAEGHSPLLPAVWNVPLPLLRGQHQDRLPGCDGQEGAAPRQSQLKPPGPGPRPLWSPSEGRRADGTPPGFALRTLWIELREGLAAVWMCGGLTGREWESIWQRFRRCTQVTCTLTVHTRHALCQEFDLSDWLHLPKVFFSPICCDSWFLQENPDLTIYKWLKFLLIHSSASSHTPEPSFSVGSDTHPVWL